MNQQNVNLILNFVKSNQSWIVITFWRQIDGYKKNILILNLNLNHEAEIFFRIEPNFIPEHQGEKKLQRMHAQFC